MTAPWRIGHETLLEVDHTERGDFRRLIALNSMKPWLPNNLLAM